MPVYRLPPFVVSEVRVALSETIDYGLAMLGVPDAWRASRGAGARVAVLDTGCAAHPDLPPVVSRDFTGSPHGAGDVQGHGTHCAGIIGARANGTGVVGVAPECALYVGKVLGDDGAGGDEQIAAGINWAVSAGADVLSLSLGSPEPSPVIHAALRAAVGRGRVVIVAAGNDGRSNSVNYPGRYPECLAVAAVDRQGRLAPFSSRGPEVDVAAPGVDVLSTFHRPAYARLSGTSMATPFVAGVVALLVGSRKARGLSALPPEEVALRVARTARDAGPPGFDPGYGFGLIDPAGLLGATDAPNVPAPGGSPWPAALACELRVAEGVIYAGSLDRRP